MPAVGAAFGGSSEDCDPDPGDAVDLLQGGDEAGHPLLPGGAAADFQRRARRSPRAGPTSRRLSRRPPQDSGEAVAVRLVSQTSEGRTSESSRITRSQSKRLSARL